MTAEECWMTVEECGNDSGGVLDDGGGVCRCVGFAWLSSWFGVPDVSELVYILLKACPAEQYQHVCAGLIHASGKLVALRETTIDGA